MQPITEIQFLEFLRKSGERHLNLGKLLKEYFSKASNRKNKKKNKKNPLER